MIIEPQNLTLAFLSKVTLKNFILTIRQLYSVKVDVLEVKGKKSF